MNPSPNQPLKQLESLFIEALDLPHADRAAWVDGLTGVNGETKSQLLTLLAAHDTNSADPIKPFLVKVPEEVIPRSIGPYRVDRLIGEGSIGAVYEAHHETTGRRAAIKLIRAGFATTRQKMRFQLEAEMLGRLNHPGIAHLYEAGLAEVAYHNDLSARRPFIAMEYVQGEPVSIYVTRNKLPIRQRVALLKETAQAVSHAHHRGIIHRDLKPGNILVDGEGRVKVVDFGVAKLIEGDGDSGGGMTHEGMVAGTPSFMSPEQLLGKVREIDLPADVYALGATLYLLLADRAPLEVSGLLSPAGIVRLLATEIQSVRRACSEVDPDLAAVVHKALERKPENRYADAAELAADLDRWLSGMPTVARPLGIVGRATKYVRRKKWQSAALAFLGLAIIGTGVGMTLAGRALLNERAALSEQEAAFRFINDMLIRVSPEAADSLGPDRKLSEFIELARKEVETPGIRPSVRANIKLTLAKIAYSMSKFDEAEQDAEEVRQLLIVGGEVGDRSLAAIEAGEVLAACYKERGRLREVAELRWEAWLWRKQHMGFNDPETLRAAAESSLAAAEWIDPKFKPPLLENVIAALEEQRQKRGSSWRREDEAALIRAREIYAHLYIELLDRPKTAVELLDTAITEATRLHGPEHPLTVRLERIKGVGMCRRGDFEQAGPFLLHVRQQLARMVGEEHSTVGHIDVLLGDIRTALGDPTEGLEIHKRSVITLTKTLGPRHYQVLEARFKVAGDLRALGRLEEAEKLMETCVADLSRVDGWPRYITSACYRQLALLREAQGRFREAADLMHKYAFEGRPPIWDHFGGGGEIALWWTDHARMLHEAGDIELALKLNNHAYKTSLESFGPDAGQTRRCKEQLDTFTRTRP